MLLRLPIVVAALALLAIGCKEEAERPVVSPVSDVQPQPEELKEQTNVASSEKVVPAGIGVSRALGNITLVVCDEVLNFATPDWSRQERNRWLDEAEQADTALDVSTLRGDIIVKVVSMELQGFVIRTISLTPAKH